ncbi:hypothetical protein QQF64_021531 [Cirrhinus molitorella]|uniref:Uncharacterized protein n=1 Tax=Cirrhinus molitorella TaxID=172907 RepID=A0ABR3L5W2_9TELE
MLKQQTPASRPRRSRSDPRQAHKLRMREGKRCPTLKVTADPWKADGGQKERQSCGGLRQVHNCGAGAMQGKNLCWEFALINFAVSLCFRPSLSVDFNPVYYQSTRGRLITGFAKFCT